MSSEEVLSEIRERMVRVETKIDNMNEVKKMAEEARDTAKESLQSTRTANRQIDEQSRRLDEAAKHYEYEVRALNARIDSENEKRRAGQRWLIGTTLTVIGLFLTAIGLLWKVVAP
ncbi:hypothetical protein [Cohnella sp. REN36]|uniref:hypothetical protein n=1 Tax=Cohnella sp. REN36 TaxID=2887347 RepID=UPI001D1587E9|nr:hypothetical protein [Cohnella sp. REN36]MCC3374747.1 hypothetical protein [Cohnella sp. REN36]